MKRGNPLRSVEHKKSQESELVSVIYPILGNYDRRRLELSILSAQMQKYTHVEIVVAEENVSPTFKTTAERMGLVYQFRKKKILDTYNISSVRNLGISASHGTYIYLNDSDIVFMSTQYITNLVTLLKQRNAAYLDFPPMKRLLEPHLRRFYRTSVEKGLHFAIKNLSLPDGYTSNNDASNPLKKFKFGTRNKISTISSREFAALDPQEVRRYWFALLHFTRHPGNIFVRRENLVAVAGYCESFEGWGCEDVDLKEKLRRLRRAMNTQAVLIPRKKKYQVLHLDHKKRFDKILYSMNEEHFKERQTTPLSTLIEHDKSLSHLC